MKESYTYIMTNQKNGTLYIGVTSNILKRYYEHKSKEQKGFTSKYGLNQLVHYEVFGDINHAIAREKELKRWHRQWKINLIEKENPQWVDLGRNFTL